VRLDEPDEIGRACSGLHPDCRLDGRASGQVLFPRDCAHEGPSPGGRAQVPVPF
jgi:hypothetical protein